MFEFDTTATRTVAVPALALPPDDEELLPHAASVAAMATSPIAPTNDRIGLDRWKLRAFQTDSSPTAGPDLRLILNSSRLCGRCSSARLWPLRNPGHVRSMFCAKAVPQTTARA
jgi:hypothetical protein